LHLHPLPARDPTRPDLTFVIDPALTFRADDSKWKDGEQKVLKQLAGSEQRGCDPYALLLAGQKLKALTIISDDEGRQMIPDL
jgi:hypothetical protein